MSSRERWIVYPLLFLTLGIAMRDKVVPPRLRARELMAQGEVLADTVRCNRLEVGQADCRRLVADQAQCRLVVVTDEGRKSAVRLGTVSEGGGRLEVFSPEGKVVLAAGTDPKTKGGMFEVLSADRSPRVRLGATDDGGGLVAAFAAEQPRWVALGYEGGEMGVFAKPADGERIVPLTLPGDFGETPLKR